MKYRTVKIGEVIPKNAEWIKHLLYDKYEPYYISDTEYSDCYPEFNNWTFGGVKIRVPIEENEVVE